MTITSPSKCLAEAKRKRAVVLTARVHPGETNSSWMMKGLLDYLTSDASDAKLLRDTFVFKVVPMLNPDGVIVGNYRCSLTGRDLNRNYKTTLKEAFPSVWHTREMIKRLNQEREITLYCDFHGHSRQQNVFMYGCEDPSNLEQGFKERVFPMMLSKNCKDKFCFKRCKFKVQKSKSGTGRVVMWNLGISNSYTMEATFCGSTLGSRAGEHFTTADFESMGYHLCDTLLDYCDPDSTKYFSILNEVEIYVKSLVLERMQRKGVAEPEMNLSDVDLDKDYLSESSTSGSDSSVSDGLPMQVIYSPKDEASKKKKKRLKTRKERNKHRTRNWNKQSKDKESNKRPEESEVRPANNNGMNGLLSEGEKNPSRASSSQSKNAKAAPSPVSHENRKARATPEPFTKVKVHDYLQSKTDAYGRNRLPSSSDGLSIPQLRYTGKQACFGLAPATPSRSLERWSVRRHKVSTSDVTEEEEENTFIGRYMARQIRFSIHRKDSHKTSPKHDSSVERYNASYKMIATAQAGDWEGRIEEVRTSRDKRDDKGHVGKYCAHHAALMRKSSGKDEKNEEHFSEGKKLSTSMPKISSSHEDINSRNSQTGTVNSIHGTEMMEAPVQAEKKGLTQENGQKTSLVKRSNSDSCFPIVNVERTTINNHHNEKRLFNFSGVTKKSANVGYNLCRKHGSSSSNYNNYFSSADCKDKQEPLASQAARVSLSEDCIAHPTQMMSSYEKNYNNEKSTRIFSPEHDNLSSEQNLCKAREDLEKEAVNRLRKKIQNLNSPGRMVSCAENNQVDDVEENTQKSLIDEYRNFQTKHHGGHPKTIFKSARSNSRQNTLKK